MTPRPASVDAQGGPMTGNGGGPMSLARPAATWSHMTGKRQASAVTAGFTERACPIVRLVPEDRLTVVILAEGLSDAGGTASNHVELALRLAARSHRVALASRWPVRRSTDRLRRLMDGGVPVLTPGMLRGNKLDAVFPLSVAPWSLALRIAHIKPLVESRAALVDRLLIRRIRQWTDGERFVIHIMGRETAQPLDAVKRLQAPIVFTEFGQLENVGFTAASAPQLRVDAYTADSSAGAEVLAAIEGRPVRFLPSLGGSDCPIVPPPNRRRFVMITRLEPIKRIDLAVAGFRGIDAVLDIYGQGSLMADLVSAAPPNASIRGPLPPSNVYAVLDEADALVSTSTSEGTPTSVLEAMSRGRAVIAPRVGGLTDLVADAITGLLFDGSLGGLRAAVEAVAADHDLACRLGRGGRERWEAEFSPDVIATKYESIYRSVL